MRSLYLLLSQPAPAEQRHYRAARAKALRARREQARAAR
jgi:hypothetical protein